MEPLPDSQRGAVDTLLRFIGFMAGAMDLRATSMSNYVAAVRHFWHRALRCDPSAGSPLPSDLISAFGAADTRAPLFRRAFPAAWLPYACSLSDDPVVALAFTVGFSFFFRVSEYCTTPEWGAILRAKHLFVVDGRLVADVPFSKTDFERRGSRHARDATGCAQCPVALFERYRTERGAPDPDSPALVWRSGRPFTSDHLNRLIKTVASHFGADPLLYSSHSLRSGGVTAMHAAGADPVLLVREGRWASIEGLFKYLRMDATAASSFTAGMLGSVSVAAPSRPVVPPR
jgi:hypothetical protein